ncbi:Uncharacterised protein [Serratia quinivorans]|uniref:hypothetical protein n=1 Tax=Serratia TaxID=613 RepID=UPI001F4C306E|nr:MULTISPECIES: hypothetical protein [Serratia]ULG13425.1 hypothetical protein 1p_00044 [Serratia proteamaculans]ULG13754.1 hypothetical protein 12ap_00066 [Serratia proteamaculans]ULG13896.1 hypothetical protein 12dp_00066 [Serratia proteamaculans]ULG14037.1 hypothetical protein 12newDp_00065 [Serratia proteamaculans]ULG14251.1 hypothetical protein 28Fp_00113 [Serratia proteamaculans]
MTRTRVFLKTLLLISLLCAGAYLIFSSIVLFIVSDSRTNALWPYVFLALGFGLIYSFYRINKKSDTKASQIINGYFCNNFIPTNGYEVKALYDGNYFGVDTKNGTMLLISTAKSIYKGMSISDLAGYECRGNTLTLKFNDVLFSHFTVGVDNEKKCMELGYNLDALLSSTYQPERDAGSAFSEFVQKKSLAY